jgi:hypothetical protein
VYDSKLLHEITPEGSLLIVILWKICITDVPLCYDKIAFMEDFMISASADFQLCTRLQVKLKKIYDWTFVRGIKFNVKKFKVLPKNLDTKACFRIRGERLKISKHARFFVSSSRIEMP